MDGTMCGNGLLGYFAGARLERSEDIGGGSRKGGSISIVYFGLTLWSRTIPRRRTRSSTASSNNLLGWRGAHAVPVHAARIAP
jgi:hypothetical protein